MKRSLYCQPIWSASHGTLVSHGRRFKDVSSALLLFSATTDSFKTVSQQSLVFDTGYGVLPARKQIQNVSLKIIWQPSFNTWILWFCYVIYTKQLVVEFIWLNASSYTCRSHQKTVVSIGIHRELTGVELSSETWLLCYIYLGGGDLNVGMECVGSTSVPCSFISSERVQLVCSSVALWCELKWGKG